MPQDKVPGNIQGKTVSYESTSFTAGDSPVVLDVYTDLKKRSCVDGYVTCDGDGDIIVEFSDDGTTYGGQHTLKSDEILELEYIKARLIRITHSGTDSSYRVLVV